MDRMNTIIRVPLYMPSLAGWKEIRGLVRDLQEPEYKISVEKVRLKGSRSVEFHRVALERMKESKEQRRKQQNQEERDAIYAQMLQDF